MRAYRPLKRLGHGSMAEVHLAELRTQGMPPQRVALKRILPSLRLDPEIKRRFAEEAEVCAALRHPNIVEVIAAEAQGEEPWIALELLGGPSLQDVVDKLEGVPATPGFAFAVGRSIAGALSYAHGLKDERGKRASLVHRDVSPKNLLWGPGGELKLIDFGLARGARPRRTHTGAVLGDAGYLSPEQSRGEVADTRSDVFSAALIVYVLCTGVHPFVADSQIEQLQRVDRCKVKVPERLGVEVPDALVRVLIRALSREPQDRYRDGGELLEALERAAPEVHATDSFSVRAELAALGFTIEPPDVVEATMPQLRVDHTATQEPEDDDGTQADPHLLSDDGTLADPGTGTLRRPTSDPSTSDLATIKDLQRPKGLFDNDD